MQKSKQQKEIETLKAKVQQLETEKQKLERANKELISIADSKSELVKEYNKLNERYKLSESSAEVFKEKYLALNNSIKYLCKANDNTLFNGEKQ